METEKSKYMRTTFWQSPGDCARHTPSHIPRCHIGEKKVKTKMALSMTKLHISFFSALALTPFSHSIYCRKLIIVNYFSASLRYMHIFFLKFLPNITTQKCLSQGFGGISLQCKPQGRQHPCLQVFVSLNAAGTLLQLINYLLSQRHMKKFAFLLGKTKFSNTDVLCSLPHTPPPTRCLKILLLFVSAEMSSN